MTEINFHRLFEARFRAAKNWHTLAECTSLVILLIDIIVIFTNRWNIPLIFIVIFITVMNSVGIWISDRQNDLAQMMLRKFEMFDSLGWKISNVEVADWLVGQPKKVRLAAHSIENDPYFVSHEPLGAKRMMENLEESAWWSKLEAGRMGTYVYILGAVTLVLTLIIGYLATKGGSIADYPERIAETAIAIFSFIFFGGYLRLAAEYKLFAKQASECEEKASLLLQGPTISDIEAVKLFYDYQIARATSPLLPEWIYNSMKKRLNEIWHGRMRESTPSSPNPANG